LARLWRWVELRPGRSLGKLRRSVLRLYGKF